MPLRALLGVDQQLGNFARWDPVLPMGVRLSETAEGLEIIFVRSRIDLIVGQH